MTAADVPAVVDVQEPGAAVGLANVFPQDVYPFPRDEIARRWVQEIRAPGIDCFVVQVGGAVVGFAPFVAVSSCTSGLPLSTGVQGSRMQHTRQCSIGCGRAESRGLG